jgi:hypothetical protein
VIPVAVFALVIFAGMLATVTGLTYLACVLIDWLLGS